jgi:methyl-galactoside transport system substrate-binding protein
MRKGTVLLIALSAVFSLGLSAAPSEGNLKATILWRRFDDPFQSGFRIIMQSQADKMGGYSLDMQDGEDDPSRMMNKLETTLTKGAKSIAICAPDRVSTDKLMQKCKSENVPVVFFNMEPMPDTMKAYDKIWYVGADAKESGKMCAQALINYWKKNNKIADKKGDGAMKLVILQGEIGQQDVSLRTQAYKDTLDAQGIKYKIIAIDTANWDKAQALDKMNAWFTAFGGDGIDGVLCNNDSMAMGAVQSALNHGYNKGDPKKFIPIVGIDATIEALQSMKNGALLGTVLNDRMGQSTAILNILKAINDGKAITKDVVGANCTVNGKYIMVPYAIVDESNLDSTLNLMTKLEGK